MNRLRALLRLWAHRVERDRDPVSGASPMQAQGDAGAYWRQAIIRTLRSSAAGHYGMVAGSIAFFSFLALLPFLAAVALIYGMVAPQAEIAENVRLLMVVVPREASRFLEDWLVRTIVEPEGRDLGIMFTLSLALFSATRAARSIVVGLNIAADIASPRDFLAKRFVAFVVVVAAAALVFVALLAISVMAFLERLFPYRVPGSIPILQLLFWSLIPLGAVVALTLVYRYAPAREAPAWRSVLPGALVAALLWFAATAGFGFYLGSFGSYESRYGSVGAIIILLIWLFLSALTLLIGARLNHELAGGGTPGRAAAEAQ